MLHLLHYIVIFCLWLVSFQVPKWNKTNLLNPTVKIEQEKQDFGNKVKDKVVYQCTMTLLDFKF